jgi:alginate O-acetyltransferase complex protein AlgI
MIFTSTVFLFVFLPLSFLLFYVVPARWRVAPLLLTSAVFYAWGEPVLVVLILLTSVFTYWWGGLLLRQGDGRSRRLSLAVGLAVVLVPIAVFKYLDFVLLQLHLDELAARTEFPLPIGVSFYTFMAIGYLVDIYRRRDDGAPHLLAFSAYLTMFPHLVAGPIVRWSHVGPQLLAPRFDPGLFGYGALRVAGGLAKKAVLADSLAVVVDDMFATGEPTSLGAAWLAAFLYSLQIYLDFSAYSDIAIGLAAMMGVRFHENFRYPYVSRSAREFWQRWHISLGSWFRDYVYIPLGGSRVRPLLLWRNLILVWALTGLWHGAAWTFVLWGLYFGVIIGLERSVYGDALARLPRVLQHGYGLLVAVLGWVLFRSVSVGQAVDYYRSMFGLSGDQPAWDATADFAVGQTWVIASIAVLLAAGAARPFMERAERLLAPEAATAPASDAERPRSSPADERPAGAAHATQGIATLTVPQQVGTAQSDLRESRDERLAPAFAAVLCAVVALLLLVATAFIVATTYSPFIYFRF